MTALKIGGVESGVRFGGSIAAVSPPFFSDVDEWWDNRTSDFATTGALIDTWTGRINSSVLTGTTTTRPTLTTIESQHFASFDGSYMQLPAGFTVDKQNESVFVVTRRRLTGNFGAVWHMTTGDEIDALYYNGQQINHWSSAGAFSPLIYGMANAQASYFLAGPSNVNVGVAKENSSSGSGNTSGTVSGGFLGLWSGGNFMLAAADVLGVLVYSRVLSTAEANQVQDFLIGAYKAQTRAWDTTFIYVGDSITFGLQSTDPRYWSYPAQLSRIFSHEPRYQNIAVSGSVIQNPNATNALVQLGFSSEYTTRWVALLIGTNDIGSGSRTDAQVIADLITYINALRTGDSTVNVLGIQILPRTGLTPTEQGSLDAVNLWIATGGAYNQTCNPSADSRLADPTNLTYYAADGLHLTNAGYGVLSGVVYTGLSPIDIFTVAGFPLHGGQSASVVGDLWVGTPTFTYAWMQTLSGVTTTIGTASTQATGAVGSDFWCEKTGTTSFGSQTISTPHYTINP